MVSLVFLDSLASLLFSSSLDALFPSSFPPPPRRSSFLSENLEDEEEELFEVFLFVRSRPRSLSEEELGSRTLPAGGEDGRKNPRVGMGG